MSPSLDELKRAFGFCAADAIALRAFLNAARPHLESIADQFYSRVEDHPTTREIVGGRDRIIHLKSTLLAWMESGLRGPHDEGFYEDRARVGRMHVRAGLPQPYILATMNLIRQNFHEIVERLPDCGDGANAATRSSIDKLIDLELAIMLESYQEDADKRLRESERNRLVHELHATGALAAGLADELRNPLNSACLQLRVLDRRLRRGSADPSVREPLRLAQADVERLARLIDDVLALAEPRGDASPPRIGASETAPPAPAESRPDVT